MNEPMKAIVVRQPWATLIALSIKTIETRPGPPNGPMRPKGVRGLPGLAIERGERIAIVAGRDKADVFQHPEPWHLLVDPENPGMLLHSVRPLPLGAVVCTAVVADSLLIDDAGPPDGGDRTPPDGLYVVGPNRDHLWGVDRGWTFPLAQDLPLGDFTPGRWGWMLTDVEPPRVFCARCKGIGCKEGDRTGTPMGYCPPCRGSGYIERPVPCKGKQGVFALPGDVAEQVTP